MIIERITLYKYKRFKLLNVNLVTYTPSSTMNIILGGNGSGKSSLVAASTPIPADKIDFGVGGYKEIEIRHNNSHYTLRSQDGKHTFIKDNEDMNKGRTNRVQLELIKEHLGLTPFIVSVLSGNKKFTDMSVQDRKDMFNVISTVSYDYAFKIFNDAKTRLRDLTGSLKISEGKLSSITSDVVDEDTYNTSISHRNALNTFQNAIRVSMPTIDDIDDPIPSLEKLYKSLVSLESVKGKSKTDTSVLITTIENKNKDIQILKDKLDAIEDRDVLDIDTLKLNKKSVELSLDNLVKLNPFKEDISLLYSYVINDIDKLKHLSSEASLHHIEFTQGELDALTSSITLKENKLDNLVSSLTKIEGEYSVLKENKDKEDVNCPSCDFQFKVGYNEKLFKEAVELIPNYKNKIDTYRKELFKLNESLDKIKKSVHSKEALRNHLSLYPSVYDFLIKGNPDSNMNRIMILLNEVKDIPKLQEDLSLIESDLKLAINTNEERRKNTKEQSDYLIDTIYRIRAEVTALAQKLKSTDHENKLIEIAESIYGEIDKARSDVDKYLDNEINKKKNIAYGTILKETDYELIRLGEVIRKYEQTKLLADELKDTISDTKARVAIMKKITNGLSHTDGLIGDSISSFIEVFLGKVNKIIGSVWAYDMCISFATDDSLTYKFPVKVDGEIINKDIKETSSGMAEIINLSFILASMEMSNINTPINLDEFAKELDAGHRRSVVDLISGMKNQVFLISHYRDLIYPFTSGSSEVSVTVLSTNNVDMSDINRYNEAIKMK